MKKTNRSTRSILALAAGAALLALGLGGCQTPGPNNSPGPHNGSAVNSGGKDGKDSPRPMMLSPGPHN